MVRSWMRGATTCDQLGHERMHQVKEKRLRKENITMWSIGHMGGLQHGTRPMVRWGIGYSWWWSHEPSHDGQRRSCRHGGCRRICGVRKMIESQNRRALEDIWWVDSSLAWHHIVDLSYDLWTTLFYFPFLVPFLLPNMSCCGPTDHKPSHHMVRILPSVLPHMNLVLILLIVCI